MKSKAEIKAAIRRIDSRARSRYKKARELDNGSAWEEASRVEAHAKNLKQLADFGRWVLKERQGTWTDAELRL